MASRDLRRRLDQFIANPRCDANVRSVVLDQPMRAVAARELPPGEAPPREGQSPFALSRGVTFERALYDAPERVLGPLADLGAVSPTRVEVLDLRLRAAGGPMVDLDASARVFASFLRGLQRLSPDEAHDEVPALVIAPTMKLPGAPLLPEGVFAADLVLVNPRPPRDGTVRFSLSVGEVKVYPDRGGHTDPTQLAGARAQAGMYVLALRRTLAALGVDRVDVSDDGFLVLAKPSSNLPSVRWPEDLRWQARRADEWWRRLRDVAAATEGDAAPSDPVAAVLAADTAYAEGCVSFCARASSCRARALDAGDGAVLGASVSTLLGGVTLLRAEALLKRSALPATDEESAFLRRVEAVDAVMEAVS